MKKTRVVLSFDDGRKDNIDLVLPLLKKYNLNATFNVTTAYVDGTISDIDKPCPNKSMSIEDVIELYKNGNEIAAHGDCHKNEIEDIRRGIKKLVDWGVVKENIGFASPNSMMPVERIKLDEDKIRSMGISYVRIGPRANDILSRCYRKIGEKTGMVKLYSKGFDCSPENVDNDFVLYSVPVMHKARLLQVQELVRDAVKQHSDCVLMFHSILKRNQPYYDDTWTWDYEKFDNLCRWLKDQRDSGAIIVGR